MIIKAFDKSQFPHKLVNLFFLLVKIGGGSDNHIEGGKGRVEAVTKGLAIHLSMDAKHLRQH